MDLNILFNFFNIETWIIMVCGALFGMFFGAMPGLSTTLALALCLPFTFWMSMDNALILIITVYVTSVYGGSISACLIGIPGTAASIVTTFDGYKLTKKGQAGLALGMSALASTIGTLIPAFFLLYMGEPYVNFALKLGPHEIFGLALWGLVLTIIMANDKIKGVIIAIFGILLACVGITPVIGISRLTFHSSYLETGIPLVGAIIGLFGMSPILQDMADSLNLSVKVTQKVPKLSGFKDLKSLDMWILIIVSSFIGYIVGMIPGTGAIVATFFCYMLFKRILKKGKLLGTGIVEGVAIPEAANNAVNPGAVLTTLVLGIPGAAEMCVLLGAFTIHGLRCGPLLLVEKPEILQIIFFAFIISALLMLAIAWFSLKAWAKAIETPRVFLWPIIFMMCIIGTYSINNSLYDVMVMIVMGFVAFFAEKYGYSVIALLMGLVLGEILETNFRYAMQTGSITKFFERPISLIIIIVIVLMVLCFQYLFKKTEQDVIQVQDR
jgi:putative tricarboxylic transport membrane protein